MKRIILTVTGAGIVMLLLSIGLLYGSMYLFPHLTEEYFSPVFRSSGPMDWMYFAHPFVLSIALKWFWERYKSILNGPLLVRALEIALVYSIVALIPVLWLSFSAIDVSWQMTGTWLVYGFIQSFAAGIVFARFNP